MFPRYHRTNYCYFTHIVLLRISHHNIHIFQNFHLWISRAVFVPHVVCSIGCLNLQCRSVAFFAHIYGIIILCKRISVFDTCYCVKESWINVGNAMFLFAPKSCLNCEWYFFYTNYPPVYCCDKFVNVKLRTVWVAFASSEPNSQRFSDSYGMIYKFSV